MYYTLFSLYLSHYKLLPRAHAQGGPVCLPVGSTKIARSVDAGITVIRKCDQTVEIGKILSSFCFLMIGIILTISSTNP